MNSAPPPASSRGRARRVTGGRTWRMHIAEGRKVDGNSPRAELVPEAGQLDRQDSQRAFSAGAGKADLDRAAAGALLEVGDMPHPVQDEAPLLDKPRRQR